jgi:hypothetical protein
MACRHHQHTTAAPGEARRRAKEATRRAEEVIEAKRRAKEATRQAEEATRRAEEDMRLEKIADQEYIRRTLRSGNTTLGMVLYDVMGGGDDAEEYTTDKFDLRADQVQQILNILSLKQLRAMRTYAQTNYSPAWTTAVGHP